MYIISKTTRIQCDELLYHIMDTIQCLIINPSFYPSREFVPDKGYSAYPNMCKRIYRILARTNYHHPEVYLKYEN
jgi:hypothetical protein